MVRVLCAALASVVVSACTPAVSKCKDVSECESGQSCVNGECRGTSGVLPDGGTGVVDGGSLPVTGCDPSDAAANASRDTDCDGLSDAEEYSLTYPGSATTNPCNRDSDNDGLSDGVEVGKIATVSLTCGSTFVPDAQPNSKSIPTDGDTDKDGVADGDEDANHNGRRDVGETDPLQVDTDCDGYSDGEERTMAPGCATDGSKKDTDGDGLADGVEGGLQPIGADPTACAYSQATYDSNSATKTNPCQADTDGDGIADGAEDTNLNGKVDTGELDPNAAADGTGVAQKACSTANLKPITFYSSGASDIALALPPSFSELSRVSRMGVKGPEEAGFIFYDPATQIVGLAISKTPAGADANAEEADARLKMGGLNTGLTQTFTSWDGFGGSVRGIYDSPFTYDIKDAINALAKNYLGADATGLLSGQAGVVGPLKVIVEIVPRSANRMVLVFAAVPISRYSGQAVFQVDDTSGGTALAQFGDFANAQCEVFPAAPNAKVDFIWVVDDSGSMDSSQRAVGKAGKLFGTKVASAGLDWRAAGASTGWYPFEDDNQYHGSMRDWTSDVNVMNGWFEGNSSFGIDGSGSERGFSGLKTFLDRTGPTLAGPVRSDAQVHLIFLTDTAEQSATSAMQMKSYLTQKIPLGVVAHGILCTEGALCASPESYETKPGKYHTLIRDTGGVIGNIGIFNPKTPTPAETAQQSATIDAILNAAIGSTGAQLQRPPISSTIKVAMASTRGTCNADDVPRDRTHGWDIDPATRRLVFFGDCRPSAPGVQVAVSYQYWNDGSPDPGGSPCAGSCEAPLVCDVMVQTCVCPADCGGCSAGFECNQNSCACEPEFR